MWSTEVVRITSAPPEAVWNRWTDLSTWPEWITVFEWARVDGPFGEGQWAEIKLRRTPGLLGWYASRRPYRWLITKVEENSRFNDMLRQFLATFYFFHRLDVVPEGTQVTQRIEITGPLGWLYARLIGRLFAEGLPEAVDNLVRLVEQETSADERPATA